ncbi:MAG: hypothetical protein GY720_10920 [bacterium]|nr:hypothetical protein [bacterium]
MASATSDDRFDGALRELAAIQSEIATTPDDQFAKKQGLREQEAALRLELREFRDSWTDHLSIDQLRRRIDDVKRRLTDHYGNRLSHISGGQAGFGGGIDPTILHRMHRAMDRLGDLDGLQAELVRLEDRLAKLEGN